LFYDSKCKQSLCDHDDATARARASQRRGEREG
jgi:hypothetical protein